MPQRRKLDATTSSSFAAPKTHSKSRRTGCHGRMHLAAPIRFLNSSVAPWRISASAAESSVSSDDESLSSRRGASLASKFVILSNISTRRKMRLSFRWIIFFQAFWRAFFRVCSVFRVFHVCSAYQFSPIDVFWFHVNQTIGDFAFRVFFEPGLASSLNRVEIKLNRGEYFSYFRLYLFVGLTEGNLNFQEIISLKETANRKNFSVRFRRISREKQYRKCDDYMVTGESFRTRG